MANVLLLRNASDDGSDPYETSMQSNGYNPISVPVLETVLTNSEELKHRISIGPEHQKLSGVILTSARACDAWGAALEELLSVDSSDSADWATVPFYVVGQATAASLAQIRDTYDSPLAPANIRGGAEAGTAERLAHFILQDFSEKENIITLFSLVGDKNRDVLPQILKSGGMELELLQVYATQASSKLADDLDHAMLTAPIGSQLSWGWITFFAPSAADFVLPTLRKYFSLPIEESGKSEPENVQIAAIGPTTAVHLRQKCGITVHAVPPKPNAEELAIVIAKYDSDVAFA